MTPSVARALDPAAEFVRARPGLLSLIDEAETRLKEIYREADFEREVDGEELVLTAWVRMNVWGGAREARRVPQMVAPSSRS